MTILDPRIVSGVQIARKLLMTWEGHVTGTCSATSFVWVVMLPAARNKEAHRALVIVHGVRSGINKHVTSRPFAAILLQGKGMAKMMPRVSAISIRLQAHRGVGWDATGQLVVHHRLGIWDFQNLEFKTITVVEGDDAGEVQGMEHWFWHFDSQSVMSISC